MAECVNPTHQQVDCEMAELAFSDYCNVCRKVYAKTEVVETEETQEPHLINYFRSDS